MSENAQQRGPDRDVDRAEPDVLLDIPKVSVDSIRLVVDGLDADLSLRARVANLLQVDAGVRVHLSGGELDVNGVHAEAQLRVRLEQLTSILGRALDTLDSNPQIIESLARTATAVDDVNRSAQQLAAGAAEVRASARRSDGVLEGMGQQVGAVADRDRPGPPDRPGPGRPGPGPVGSEPRAGGPGPRAGGPGPADQSRPAGQHPEAREPEGQHPAGPRPEARESAGRGPEGRTGRSGDRPDQAAAPGPSPSGDGDGGLSATAQAAAQNAAQLAEQAGETLRQAGRSVWEAIQGSVVQHRPQGRHDR
ncbi:hypothetical protein O7614_02470 [Micromonospora sp. WMMD961]|uniref:hypothetical protein n=1 Tax=Micromonospora sp. WMMD961 TaxID=3016100 RepID=UPI002416FFE6|nr:hypothetical protein [Micromonospora sp. WMMD961]MDG4778512.1 hypothetical protein [Micromonospora sp. WMMD961]